MKSIFVRILTGFVAVSFVLIAAMSGIFTVAVSRSINEWNAGKRNDFVALILPAISKTYRLEGSLSSSSLENAVMPYTTDSLYIYIFDGNKKPVLLLEKGKVSTQEDVEKSVGSLSTFMALNSPVQIKDGGKTIGYLCADNVGFLAYKANRIFVSTMEKGLFAGIAIAVSITLALSLFISTVLSKKARSLADYISSPDLMKKKYAGSRCERVRQDSGFGKKAEKPASARGDFAPSVDAGHLARFAHSAYRGKNAGRGNERRSP